MADQVFVHPQGLCDSDQVGPGTKIWAFAHVMKGSVVGSQCNIGMGAFVESGAVLGDRVTVKNGVHIWDGVRVENGVFLGPACVLTNRRWPRSRQGQGGPKPAWDPILIKEGATVGAGAVLVCPLTVGRWAMIGAGAVVTQDVPDFALVVGHPARRVGWVCKCGQKISDELTCSACGLAYFLDNSGALSLK